MEVENGEKGKKRRVATVMGRAVREEKGLLGISCGSRGQALVGLFFSNHIHQVYSFLGFLRSRNRAHFLLFFPRLIIWFSVNYVLTFSALTCPLHLPSFKIFFSFIYFFICLFQSFTEDI